MLIPDRHPTSCATLPQNVPSGSSFGLAPPQSAQRIVRRVWLAKPQCARCTTRIGDPLLRLKPSPLCRGLDHSQRKSLTQLRNAHVALMDYLACIKMVDSHLCHACDIPETVLHYIFS
ncbi:hypothetical protein FKP32DRAFT_1558308 [Trametes sanguinea]|nr:hypothetical protein FKP32DRAFT_1558308 [Trametes sanguinea]